MENTLLPTGSTLKDGTIRVDGHLGSGGFGNTYLVTNLQENKQYAMKEFFLKGINERDSDQTVSVSNPSNEDTFYSQKHKFGKEARRLMKLSCPNIVKVYDQFDEKGTSYYVMEYVHGKSLNQKLQEMERPLSEDEAMPIYDQLLNALDAIHLFSLWHLDIKPGNILIEDSGRVVLIDFGSSKQTSPNSDTTTTTGLCYTPGYAPIEQIAQSINSIGAWTDIYALGATLYYMLTGKQPPKPDQVSVASSFVFPDGVGDITRQLVKWSMRHDKTERPQSVAEVRQFLQTGTIITIPPKEDAPITQEPVTGGSTAPFGFSPNTGGTITSQSYPGSRNTNWPPSQQPAKRDYTPTERTRKKENLLFDKNNVAGPSSSSSKRAFTQSPLVGGGGGSNDKPTDNEKKKTSPVIWLALCLLVLIIAAGAAVFLSPSDDKGSKEDESDGTEITIEEDTSNSVRNLKVTTPKEGRYTGEVNNDQVPNGQGKLRCTDGERFEGEFTNGEPTQGTWYNADGTVKEQVPATAAEEETEPEPAAVEEEPTPAPQAPAPAVSQPVRPSAPARPTGSTGGNSGSRTQTRRPATSDDTPLPDNNTNGVTTPTPSTPTRTPAQPQRRNNDDGTPY